MRGSMFCERVNIGGVHKVGEGGQHLQKRSLRPVTVLGEDLHCAHRGRSFWCFTHYFRSYLYRHATRLTDIYVPEITEITKAAAVT